MGKSHALSEDLNRACPFDPNSLYADDRFCGNIFSYQSPETSEGSDGTFARAFRL
jgi:hypothetical protein